MDSAKRILVVSDESIQDGLGELQEMLQDEEVSEELTLESRPLSELTDPLIGTKPQKSKGNKSFMRQPWQQPRYIRD